MALLRVYAKMANNVYEVPDGVALRDGLPSGWSVYDAAADAAGEKGGTVHNSGFKGCIYRSASEVVVAFKGTGGGKGFQDFLADVKLAVGVVPREATPANALYRKASGVFGDSPNRPITVVGHSLGGGLTQLIGHWYKVRFVTFNAPPMGGCIQKAKINIFKPQQMVRAIAASKGPGAEGYNYRVQGDIVSSRKTSSLGHYGKVIMLNVPGVSGKSPLKAHSMDTIVDYLNRSSDGNVDPFS
jgi:hypothetical protein